MRIDAHVHFLHPERLPYPWLPPEPSVLRRAWLPDDLRPVLARNRFDGCVAVQATTEALEAEWLLSLAAEHSFIKGVVAWVDLTDPQLGRRLDELQRSSSFSGVRHPVHDEDDDEWLLRVNVLQGLREVARRDLPFDLLLRPKHLALIPRLADEVPGLRMVLDHIGKPAIREREFEGWAASIRTAAALPQLAVKISGIITEAEWKTWLPEHFRPHVQHVWSSFGPDRCLFGSDWPVCLQAGIWKEVLAGFTQALGPVDKDTRAGVMGQNASRIYRLAVSDTAPEF